jgi:hypothetical protein
MVFSFKTVGYLQVIHQPLSRPKQIRAGEYAVDRKIGLERVNVFSINVEIYTARNFTTTPSYATHINTQEKGRKLLQNVGNSAK